MHLLSTQIKKRLYTPAFQTPLPKEDLDRIIQNTITRQLAREAVKKVPTAVSFVTSPQQFLLKKGLEYGVKHPEQIAKFASGITSAPSRLLASFGASAAGRKEPLPAPSKLFSPKQNILTRFAIGEEPIQPFAMKVDKVLDLARKLAAKVNKKKPEQVTWDEMLTPTVFMGLGLGVISAAEAEISIGGGGKNARLALEQGIKELKSLRALEKVDTQVIGKILSETSNALKKVRGNLEGIGKTVDDFITAGEKALAIPVKGKVVKTLVDETKAAKPLLPSGKPTDISTAKASGMPFDEWVKGRKLSQKQMLVRGAGGHLTEAYETEIPLSKIDGREPTPAMEDGYKKGTEIKQPIEVVYQSETDTYILYAGNHRVTQAEINGQKTIKAFVQDNSSKTRSLLKAEWDAVQPAPKPLVPTEGKKAKPLLPSGIKGTEPKLLTGQTAIEGEGFFMSPSGKRRLAPEIRIKREIEAIQRERAQTQRKAEIQKVKIQAKKKEISLGEKFTAEIKELTQRRERLQISRDFLGLSDDDIRKVSRKDIRFMQKTEFNDFLNDLEAKSTQLVQSRQLKNEIVQQIQDKELKKVNSLRQFLEFPKLEDMTTEQLRQFNDALIPFQKGDEFLSLRKLQTVDNTELKGIRTLREAKERLAKKINVSLAELDNIKVSPLDRFRYDTALARRNEFYRLLVDETNQSILTAEKRFLELKQEINDLTKKARASRKRTIFEKAVPTDDKVFSWLEAPEMGEKASDITKADIMKEMTPQEIDLANYLQTRFADFRDYLLEHKTLEKYRSNYITHIRRGFLEAWKEDGLLNAFKEVFAQYKLEEATFKILDNDTQNILPLEKFFQFAMRRTGELTPSKNVAQAFLAYTRAFLKKQALDRIVPELDIYTYSLTPRKLTPRGLEMDRTLKKFVNEWINTKKGRVTSFGGLIPQGGAIDIGLRGIKSFVTLLDLGLNIPVGLTVQVGEQVTNFLFLGSKQYAQGVFRMNTAQGKRIVEKYKIFVGESPWRTLSEASDTIGDTFNKGLFSLFRDAQVRANKGHLLGSLSSEEWAKETLSDERLVILNRELGRYRIVSGAKSIVGATSAGGIATQYRTWAVPILSSTLDNLSQLSRMIGKGQFRVAVQSKNFHELLRATLVTLSSVLVVGSLWGDEDDNSFIGKIKKKAYRDSLSVLGAIDPRTWTNPTRVTQFLQDLGESASQIVLLEKYITKEGFKGVEKLKRTLTPTVVKQIIENGGKTKKESVFDSLFKTTESDKQKAFEVLFSK